ncbi:MAG: PEP/pyruvate-binding domain-containing protein, partial [Desulfosarcina sp.]
AGVMFTIDTQTGFPDVVVINAAWGLGESVVQGSVTPDEYVIFKPPLKKEASLRPIIGKTRGDKEKKMVYARGGSHTTKTVTTSGKERLAFVLSDEEILQLARWACAIEDHYGRPMDIEWARDGESGDLYIVQARPETVQSRRQANTLKHYRLKEEGTVLVAGLAIGEAIAAGKACRLESADDIDDLPQTRTQIMMNIASPAGAFRWWRLPAKGIGLARMEFIVNDVIKVHPLALVHFDDIEDKKVRKQIERITRGYADLMWPIRNLRPNRMISTNRPRNTSANGSVSKNAKCC